MVTENHTAANSALEISQQTLKDANSNSHDAPKKVVILGGSGLIGQAFKHTYQHEFAITTFNRHVFESPNALFDAIKDADYIIQLSGANLGKRWNKKTPQELLDSRVITTEKLAQAIQKRSTAPAKVLCASAIGFYPEKSCHQPLDESHSQAGEGFLAQISVKWETAARQLAPTNHLVITRFGVVLDKNQGALAKMLPAFRLGLGGPVAGGEQCFSWIHIHDCVRAIRQLMLDPTAHGIFNVTAPEPLKQKVFAKYLGKTLKRPAFLPLPLWQLKLMFGEGAQVLTHSSAVVPTRLLEMGFEFEYPTAPVALQNLLN